MTSREPAKAPLNRGVVAGTLIVATIILCAGIGFGVGAIFGAAVPLGIAGVFVGVAGGIALVVARFGDL